jgi:hypothetical protein
LWSSLPLGLVRAIFTYKPPITSLTTLIYNHQRKLFGETPGQKLLHYGGSIHSAKKQPPSTYIAPGWQSQLVDGGNRRKSEEEEALMFLTVYCKYISEKVP